MRRVDGGDTFHCFLSTSCLPPEISAPLWPLCLEMFSSPVCVCGCVGVSVSVYLFVSLCVYVCCRTGENKSPAVVLISSSFVSALRDQLSALGLPLQLHLLPTIITPFNANATQTAARKTHSLFEWETKERLDYFHTQQVCKARVKQRDFRIWHGVLVQSWRV